MGLLDKAEQRIEGAVSSLFSKLSRAELQPVEITQAIRSAMDLAAKADTVGSTVVPTATCYWFTAPMPRRLPRHALRNSR